MGKKILKQLGWIGGYTIGYFIILSQLPEDHTITNTAMACLGGFIISVVANIQRTFD